MPTKKTRSCRATAVQYARMLDFFNINKGLAEGRMHALHGKETSQKKWVELAAELNNLQGAIKTPEQWQVVWRDLKSRTSVKARELKKAKAATGNKSITLSELSEMELRVIGIVGPEYVRGNSICTENIPEEESLQDELVKGNDSVLLATQETSSVCEDRPISSENRAQLLDTNIDFDAIDGGIVSDESVCRPTSDGQILAKIREGKRKRPGPTTAEASTRHIMESLASSRKSNRMGRAAELNASRQQFQSVLEKQTETMTVLAEASKLNAEAAMINAQAMAEMAKAATSLANTANIQAVTNSKIVHVFEKLTQVLENLLPSYLE